MLTGHVKVLSRFDFSDFSELLDASPFPEGATGWYQTLAAATLENDEHCVLVAAFDNRGRAHAALPLVRGRSGALRSLTAPYSTRFAPGLDQLDWSYYLGCQARKYIQSELRLEALDLENANICAFIKGVISAGLSVAPFRHFANWYEHIDNFDRYWAKRPSRLKSTARRKLATLTANYKVSFECHSEGPSLIKAAADYEEVYCSSWKSSEPHPKFISTLIENLTRSNLIRLGTLSIDGKVIAAQIWLVKGQNATIFKLAHLQEFVSQSPGTLLTQWLLRHLVERENISLIDFGRGDDQYKKDWLSSSQNRSGLIVANWRSLHGLRAIVGTILPTIISNAVRNLR